MLFHSVFHNDCTILASHHQYTRSPVSSHLVRSYFLLSSSSHLNESEVVSDDFDLHFRKY